MDEDPLTRRRRAERDDYIPGALLDADAFRAEQAYHRGQLAKVVNDLHGSGTVAGLKVTHDPVAGHLVVSPGLAIDRVGRVVELHEAATVDLSGWLAQSGSPSNVSRVCVDVHVRFHTQRQDLAPSCESLMPEVVASIGRLVEGAEVVLRAHRDPPPRLPKQTWWARIPDEDAAAWERRVQDHLLNAMWDHKAEDALGADPTAVFLARVTVGTQMPAGVPVSQTVQIDNHSRAFVYPNAILVAWLQALTAGHVDGGD